MQLDQPDHQRGDQEAVGGEAARAIEILLVEDDEMDAELTRLKLEQGRLANKIHVVETGEEALELLRERGEQGDPMPDLLLLDLSLPGMGGLAVPETVKTDPKLQDITAVVLTGSGADQDVVNSYMLQANAFMTKPIDVDQLLKFVRTDDTYWFTLVKAPAA